MRPYTGFIRGAGPGGRLTLRQWWCRLLGDHHWQHQTNVPRGEPSLICASCGAGWVVKCGVIST